MSFSHLGLSDKVLAAVAATGYTTPTPIQEQAIPHVLARRDVLGIAQTGTGKTAAFVLPMLTMLEKGRARARMPRTLILEPTRELAAQVKEQFDKYGVGQKLNVALLIGGVSFGDQDTKLTRGVDVLIATPGRLLDHTERGGLLLTGVELLVIDEADRMLDMGFIPDIERICKLVPFTRQTLFFSATMPPEISRITEAFLHNPERIEVSRPATTAVGVSQFQVPAAARRTRSAKCCAACCATPRISRTRSSSATASAKSPSSTSRCRSTASASAPCMATWTSRPAPRRSINSARAKFRCWSASDVAARGLDIPGRQPRLQFRRAASCRRLRPPHRPYRPRRPRRHRDFDRHLARQQIDRRDRKTDRTNHSARRRRLCRAARLPPANRPPRATSVARRFTVRGRSQAAPRARAACTPRDRREASHERAPDCGTKASSPAAAARPNRGTSRAAASVRSRRHAAFAPPAPRSPPACPRSVARNRAAPSATQIRARRSLASSGVPAAAGSRPRLTFGDIPLARAGTPFTGRSFSSLNLAAIILIIAAATGDAARYWGVISGQAAGRTRTHNGLRRSRVGPDQIPPADRRPAQL